MFGFGILLSIDALHMIHCKRAMVPERLSLLDGKVLKEKKNRRGALVWTVEFTRPDGTPVTGKREGFQHLYGMKKPGDHVPILNVEGAPECWDISTQADRPAAYEGRQNFAITISGGFGVFFILSGAALSVWSFRKLFFSPV